MKRRQLIRHLRENGCDLIREGGKHSWWGNSERGTYVAVPRHREIPNALAKKICKELEIPHLYNLTTFLLMFICSAGFDFFLALLVKEGQEIRASVAGVLMCYEKPDDYLK